MEEGEGEGQEGWGREGLERGLEGERKDWEEEVLGE